MNELVVLALVWAIWALMPKYELKHVVRRRAMKGFAQLVSGAVFLVTLMHSTLLLLSIVLFFLTVVSWRYAVRSFKQVLYLRPYLLKNHIANEGKSVNS